MLLNEWFAWWGEMPPIRADEHLDSYMVHMLGDSGWTVDRDVVLDAWRKLARRDEAGRISIPDTDKREGEELRQQFYRTRNWLRMHYGGGIGN